MWGIYYPTRLRRMRIKRCYINGRLDINEKRRPAKVYKTLLLIIRADTDEINKTEVAVNFLLVIPFIGVALGDPRRNEFSKADDHSSFLSPGNVIPRIALRLIEIYRQGNFCNAY